MDKLSQKYIQTVAFRSAIDREELLIRKCIAFENMAKDKNLQEMANDFKKSCEEHIKMLKDKMIKLNIQIKE